MKNYKKMMTALAGIILAGAALCVLPAHAEEILDLPEPIPTADPYICIEPWWHEYKLENLDLHAGDVLQLEFTAQGDFSMRFDLFNAADEVKAFAGDYLNSNSASQVIWECTIPEDMDSVKVYSMVFSDNDAELTNYKVIPESDQIYVRDAVMLTKYLHGQQSISKSEFEKYDRNQDSVVNIFDFLLVKQELIGEITADREEKVTAVTTIDSTASVTVAGWDSAMSNQNYVIQSFEELQEVTMPLFKPAVVRSLEETYNPEFFEDNILCLNLWAQNPEDDFYMQIGNVSSKQNQLLIDYDKIYINGFVGEKKVLISQVAVPKYDYDAVVWGMKDAVSIPYEYDFDSIEGYEDTLVERSNALISSYEELTKYAEILPGEIAQTVLGKYTEEFFETKSVYFRPVSYEEPTRESAWNVTKTGNYITADIKISRTPTDFLVGTIGLGQLILEKQDAENAKIYCRACEAVMKGYSSNETFEDEMHFYPIPGTGASFCVNQYQFRNENALEFYWYYSGSGGNSYHFIESVKMDSDFRPFFANVNDVLISSCEEESYHISGKNYHISYNEESSIVTVTFRKSENSEEFITKEYSVQDIWG
ncbi:MAG: hypothetical protein K2H89_11780 [Oscillospiraceae bacterium]|nr:hypothetical protein [Oscillospiraceae bacterium]